MEKLDFTQALNEIVAADPRYDRDAYQFVRDGLDFTVKTFRKNVTGPERHVAGQELLEGLRRFALQQFGPMAKTVLNYWGITRGEDFGEIVFNMVEKGVLGKTDKDSRDDFKNAYDFEDVFVKPYKPARALPAVPPPPRHDRPHPLPQSDRTSDPEKLSNSSN